MKQGSLRRLAQLVVLSASGTYASCVPMLLHYYVPAAEGAGVVSHSSSGDPPYMVSMFGGPSHDFHLMVSLAQPGLTGIHDPSLTLIINPFVNAQIAVDPTLIRVEADGQAVQPKYIQYHVGKSASGAALDAHGPIDIKTDYLIIVLPLGISGALDVVTHLPPITVGGQVSQVPDVSFQLEKHTRLIKSP
jgi:hypothetical protein